MRRELRPSGRSGPDPKHVEKTRSGCVDSLLAELTATRCFHPSGTPFYHVSGLEKLLDNDRAESMKTSILQAIFHGEWPVRMRAAGNSGLTHLDAGDTRSYQDRATEKQTQKSKNRSKIASAKKQRLRGSQNQQTPFTKAEGLQTLWPIAKRRITRSICILT